MFPNGMVEREGFAYGARLASMVMSTGIGSGSSIVKIRMPRTAASAPMPRSAVGDVSLVKHDVFRADVGEDPFAARNVAWSDAQAPPLTLNYFLLTKQGPKPT